MSGSFQSQFAFASAGVPGTTNQEALENHFWVWVFSDQVLLEIQTWNLCEDGPTIRAEV